MSNLTIIGVANALRRTVSISSDYKDPSEFIYRSHQWLDDVHMVMKGLETADPEFNRFSFLQVVNSGK